MINISLTVLSALLFYWPIFALALEKGPNLRVQIADQALTLEWSSVSNAISYKGYYKDFPLKKDQEYSSVDLGNITSLTTEIPYGSKFVIAISAVTNKGETERSSFKTVQIDSSKGTYIENAADALNYNWSSVSLFGNPHKYSYSGLPSYSFKNAAGDSLFLKQYPSNACWPKGNEDKLGCGHPTVSRVYKYNKDARKFVDVTEVIFTTGDTFTIPPYREAVVADFNGDGSEDIAFANNSEGTTRFDPNNLLAFDTGWKTKNFVMMSGDNGKYSIVSLHSQVDYSHSIAASDIDNDGDVDIYMGSLSPIDGINGDSTWAAYLKDKSIWKSHDQKGGYFLINDGTGKFSRSEQRLNFGESTLLADLDNDGVDELINGIHQRGCSWGVCATDWGLGIYKRDSSGSYNLTQGLINPLPYQVSIDADQSVPSTVVMDDEKKVFLQYVSDIQSLDVNNDGLKDLVVHSAATEEPGQNGAGGKAHNFYTILINKGDLNFDLSIERFPLLMVDTNSLFLKIIDMDGDGHEDIILRSVGGGGGYFSDKIANEVYYNDGFGFFSNVNKLGLPNVSGIIDPSDVDGDGDLEVIITTGWDVVNLPGSIASFTTRLWLNE